MAKLKHKGTVPPGGWRYLQIDTGLWIEGESFGDLVDKAIRHRTHKGIDPKDADSVAADVERQICSRLGESFCKAEGRADDWIPMPEHRVMDMAAIKAGTAAVWEWIRSGGALVPMAEAERRAEICRTCPANSDTGQGCMKCSLNKIVVALLPHERRLFGLKTCLRCGCDLRSLVNAPDNVLRASHEANPVALPLHCWKKEIVESL